MTTLQNYLDVNDTIKLFLAFFIIYKEVFAGTNKSLKNYIEKIRLHSQTGGAIERQQIEIDPLYNAVKINTSNDLSDSHGIFSTLTNVTHNVTDTLYDATEMSKDVLFNYSQDFLTKSIKYTTITVLTIFMLAQEEIQNTSLEMISKVVNKKIAIYSSYLEKLSNDPEHVKAIKELSAVITDIIGEVVQAIEPSLLDLIKKIEDASKNVSGEAADGIVRTGTSLLQSILAEIPGLGGIIDLIITGGVAFNSYMKFAKISANEGDAIVDDFKQIASEVKAIVDKKKNDITNALNKFDEATKLPSMPEIELPKPSLPNTSLPNASLPNASLPKVSLPNTSLPNASLIRPSLSRSASPNQMTGGAFAKKRKNMQKKILKTSKRISNSINSFIGTKKRKTKRNRIKK